MTIARARIQPVPSTAGFAGEGALADAAVPTLGRTQRARLQSLSVVVPCFNEAGNLDLLLPRLRTVLSGLVPDWEVILVDDGSRDQSVEVLSRWARTPGFEVVRLSRNFGKEVALTAGLDAARCDAAVLMDADLQHPPELIPQLVARWQEGYDVVFAARRDRGDERWMKRAGARWFYRLVNVGGRFQIPPDAGDFRLLGRAAIDALQSLPERTRFMKGLYAWIGLETARIEYAPDARATGRSSFSPMRLLALSLDGLTSFTTWPLRLVSATGLLLACLALLYGGYLVVDYLLHGHPIPGYTTIVVGIALLSGIQLIALGVLGEYVSRIYEEVKDRPLYVVAQRAGCPLHPQRQ